MILNRIIETSPSNHQLLICNASGVKQVKQSPDSIGSMLYFILFFKQLLLQVISFNNTYFSRLLYKFNPLELILKNGNGLESEKIQVNKSSLTDDLSTGNCIAKAKNTCTRKNTNALSASRETRMLFRLEITI